MGKSEKNLWEAFAGESQANRKYLAYARQAEREGLMQAAKLFRAAAEAETVHALSHLRVLGKVRDTRENLRDAIAGETHEFKTMYPRMIREAREEENKAAELTFTYAFAAEEVHAKLFRSLLDDPDRGQDTDYFVCGVCGYTCENEPPQRCPLCGAGAGEFIAIT